MHEALDIDTHKLTPTMKVSNLLQEINEQLLTMFQFENMISQRTQDFDLLTEKEEQIKELVQAHTWVIKKNLIH